MDPSVQRTWLHWVWRRSWSTFNLDTGHVMIPLISSKHSIHLLHHCCVRVLEILQKLKATLNSSLNLLWARKQLLSEKKKKEPKKNKSCVNTQTSKIKTKEALLILFLTRWGNAGVYVQTTNEFVKDCWALSHFHYLWWLQQKAPHKAPDQLKAYKSRNQYGIRNSESQTLIHLPHDSWINSPITGINTQPKSGIAITDAGCLSSPSVSALFAEILLGNLLLMLATASTTHEHHSTTIPIANTKQKGSVYDRKSE